MALGTASLALGLAIAAVGLCFAWMGIAWFLRLYRARGENGLVDACFQLVALLVIALGLTPEPSWNRAPTMLFAIAGSWQVYALPLSAIVLGSSGALLARRTESDPGRSRLAAAATRFSIAGAILGGFTVAVFLGWLAVHRAVWG